MPEETSKVVQAAFAAWARGGGEAMLEFADPEIVVVQLPEQVDTRPYHGHDGLLEATEGWVETWDDYEIELLEMREIGDRVVVSLHQRGRGKGSGVAMEGDVWFVNAVRGGKIVRWEMFSSEAEALEAAGAGAA